MHLNRSSAAAEVHTASGPGFVGRVETLQRLAATLEGARDGDGCIVLLSGDRGIGKTRTAEQLLALARDRGMEVLHARCDAEPATPVLGPWVEILSQLARPDADPRTSWPLSVRHFMHVATGEPAPGEPEPLEPVAARMRLLEGLARVLLAVPEGGSRLIWIDDADLADPLSLRLLLHVAAELEQRPLLLLVTLREGELCEGARATVASIERLGTARSLRLPGLELAEVDAYAREGLGPGVSRRLVERLHAASQGNPFVLAACVERATRERNVELPGTVAAAARAKLAMLGPSCLDLMSVASVMGRVIDRELLQATAGAPGQQVQAGVTEALRCGVLSAAAGPERLLFSHPLLWEALYEALPSSRRSKLHERVALALEKRAALQGGKPALLATHYHRTLDAVHSAAAERHALRAARQAGVQHGYEQAADFIRMALDARRWVNRSDADARSGELLISLVRAEFAAGRFEAGEQALARLRTVSAATGKPQLTAEALLAALWAADAPAAAPLAAQPLPEVLQALPEEDHALRARVLARMAASQALPANQRKRLATQAGELAASSGCALAVRAAERARIHALSGADHVGELLLETDAALRSSRQRHDLRWTWDLHAIRYVTLLTAGHAAELVQELDALDQLTRELDDPIRGWHTARLRLERDLWGGRWDDARERLAHQRLRGRTLVGSRAEFFHAVALFQWTRARGGPMSYRAADSERMERDAQRAGASFRSAFALFLGRTGRTADARERLAALARADFELVRNAPSLEPMVYVAELSALLGELDHARRVYELLLPYAQLNAVSTFGWCMGSVSHSLGLLANALGRSESAREHLQAACDMHARLGAEPLLLQSRAALAACR